MPARWFVSLQVGWRINAKGNRSRIFIWEPVADSDSEAISLALDAAAAASCRVVRVLGVALRGGLLAMPIGKRRPGRARMPRKTARSALPRGSA